MLKESELPSLTKGFRGAEEYLGLISFGMKTAYRSMKNKAIRADKTLYICRWTLFLA